MDLAAAEIVAALIIVFGGAVIRGFTGFGASLIWVSGLSLLMDPAEAVPIIFCLEIAASAHLFRGARSHVDWASVRYLVLGAIAGLPVGVSVLSAVDADAMGVVISVVVLGSAVVLALGWQLRRSPGRLATAGVGLASGALNGATSAGGPPVIVLYLGSPEGVATGRASMIAYFGLLDALGLGVLAIAGLVDATALLRFVVFVPSMLLGARVGEQGFGRASEATGRRVAIAILVALAVTGLVNRI